MSFLNHLKTLTLLLFMLGITTVVVPTAKAQVIIDFDSFASTTSGSAVNTYLAGYGVTFSSTTSGISPIVESTTSSWWLGSASAPNVFGAFGSASLFSYTLSFSSLLDSFSFTRVGTVQAWMSAWSATAYSADNTILGTVGEPNLIGHYNVPGQTFTLSGPGIDHVLFTDNAFNFAGVNARFDDLTLTAAVPEPEIYAMMGLGLGMMGWAARRRKRKEAATV